MNTSGAERIAPCTDTHPLGGDAGQRLLAVEQTLGTASMRSLASQAFGLTACSARKVRARCSRLTPSRQARADTVARRGSDLITERASASSGLPAGPGVPSTRTASRRMTSRAASPAGRRDSGPIDADRGADARPRATTTTSTPRPVPRSRGDQGRADRRRHHASAGRFCLDLLCLERGPQRRQLGAEPQNAASPKSPEKVYPPAFAGGYTLERAEGLELSTYSMQMGHLLYCKYMIHQKIQRESRSGKWMPKWTGVDRR